MFDIGFSEMVVIGMVALIVIGPEKLPKVARTVGILLGRAQRYVDGVKSDINRQMQFDELKQMQDQMAQQARELENSIKQDVHSVEAELNKTIAPPGDTSAAAIDKPVAAGDELYRGFEPPKPTPAQPTVPTAAAAHQTEVPAEKTSA
jgi:sec-independent protein translocase protein TatB